MQRLTDIDLRLLRIFCTVVDCNGFQNARLALNMAQSTLSTHMTNLEARLGSRLCERGRAGFRLTAAGEETHIAALELFRSVDGFQNRMARMHGGETERLRIGTIDSVATNAELDLAGAIATFTTAYPNVFIDLDVLPAEALQREVAEGRRDLVLGPAQPASATLTVRSLPDERHVLYCGSSHPWFARKDASITPDDFQAARFSVRSYRYFDDVYRLGAVRASAKVSSMEAQEIMILSGAFVGFLPQHAGAHWVNSHMMRAVRPTEWGFESRFQVVYDDSTGRRPLKRALAQILTGHRSGKGRDA